MECARAQGLRILLDIVPNHMSASEHDPWWDDVLAHGPFSGFVEYFDFRNQPGEPFRVHLCSLARPYGEALEAGELTIEIKEGRPRVRHYDKSWPLGPASWRKLLSAIELGPADGGRPADDERCFGELERMLGTDCAGEKECGEYRRHAAQAECILSSAHSNGQLALAAERVRANKELLDAVLQRQFYQLHGWKLSGELTAPPDAGRSWPLTTNR